MEKKYRINEKFEVLDYDTNKYIFDNESGFVFEINEIGYKIIRFIQLNKSIEEIIIFLSNEYGNDIIDIEKDVNEFVSQLCDKKIISI